MSIIERAIKKVGHSRGIAAPEAHREELIEEPIAPETAAAPEPPPGVVESDAGNSVPVAPIGLSAEPPEPSPSDQPEEGEAGRRQEQAAREVRLDLEALDAAGMVTPHAGQTLLAEQYRMIKRPLLAKAILGAEQGAGKHYNLIMVTSALPNEGKTFTAVNLAMSMAMELDRTVLLVDSDVAKSGVTNTLGIEVVDGLTDYLTSQDMPLSQVLLKTNVPKLTVLPAGREHSNVTELLASEEMRRLMKELSERYGDRVIIFDSPPLLATSGAGVLASIVGQIAFVVQAERTTKSAVKEALKQISGHENVGLVLNRSRERQHGRYRYSYGYGYGYGYGG